MATDGLSLSFSTQELGRLRQAVLLGAQRHPVSPPERLASLLTAQEPARDPVLTLIALASQQQRFARTILDREAPATPNIARSLHQDPQPILPDPARRALLRLADVVEKGAADAVLSVAVRRIVQAGFRPHPFDLPQLAPHIKGDAQCQGLAERAFLALAGDGRAMHASSFLHPEITPDNWIEFSKEHRIAFLRSERRKHPAEARTMLEAAIGGTPAAIRADLLSALDVGLSAHDLPFLESLATDRAESVRATAGELVSRVPGTPAFAARLKSAANCFSRTGGGILGRFGLANGTIAFRAPSSGTPAGRRAILTSLFNGLSAAEVASAAGSTAADIIGALPADDEPVLAAFSARAARDGDREVMILLTKARLDDGPAEGSPAAAVAWLAGNLAAPVSAEFGEWLLACERLRATIQRIQDSPTPAVKDDGSLVWTAALLPSGVIERFLDLIEPLPPAANRTARAFAELTMALGWSSQRGDGTHDDGNDRDRE